MQATLTPTRTGFHVADTVTLFWRSLRSAAANLRQAWRRARERRCTDLALRQLSPWMLRDLGFDASDIPSIAAVGDSDTTRRRMAHF